ncbi:Endoplasmic reticulum, protein Pkr1 [Plasmopara halstedii]|uniref:Endoplasmic reticulum, protein Pkr1 n=1 Tax=Plasmopara halstedii TaxID=4781 RepID=A0A0P1AMZ1_PLAHL|nr:Endoplasmic reticulum, protein Pkr1 [Plasmopara halstedii]CEG42565.1 Endoplasmic reticulum, protein Pkr1 [Plasmopara halstedii]|eukprot:XP_024578934.1 Endoplasmic reticulum, protein Pkr1 [Plasmopara halstedii]
MQSVVQNFLRPGSREFVIVLNVVLALLFVVMLSLVYTELEDSYHVFIMLFLVIGLTISINWFMIEAKDLKHIHVAQDDKQSEKSSQRPKTN